jgi:hypothetical protein
MTHVDQAVLNLTERMCRRFQMWTGRTNVWLAFQLTNLSVIVLRLATRPLGVSRRSALSILSRSRCSARDVNMLFTKDPPPGRAGHHTAVATRSNPRVASPQDRGSGPCRRRVSRLDGREGRALPQPIRHPANGISSTTHGTGRASAVAAGRRDSARSPAAAAAFPQLFRLDHAGACRPDAGHGVPVHHAGAAPPSARSIPSGPAGSRGRSLASGHSRMGQYPVHSAAAIGMPRDGPNAVSGPVPHRSDHRDHALGSTHSRSRTPASPAAVHLQRARGASPIDDGTEPAVEARLLPPPHPAHDAGLGLLCRSASR